MLTPNPQKTSVEEQPNLQPATPLLFKVPLVTVLPDAVGMLQALRPLRQRVRSRRFLIIDEEATAERIVTQGIRAPLMRPMLVRRFDLVLLIDSSASMRLWRRTIGELWRVLEHSGAFRQVIVANFVSDTPAGLVLRAGTGFRNSGRDLDSQELADPSGRRMIVVLSDCLGQAWRDGRISALLADWGSNSGIAVFHMLPTWLWSRTAFGTERIGSVRSAGTNVELIWESPDVFLFGLPAQDSVFPLIALSPTELHQWSLLSTGNAHAFTTAATLSRAPMEQEPNQPSLPEESASPIARFREMVTPRSRELAGFLAAVPLTLPVVRLVTQMMRPPASVAHFAELLLSGIVHEQYRDPDPERTLYEFAPGLREYLLNTVTVRDAVITLQRVDAFLSSQAAQALDVARILAEPEQYWPGPISPNRQPLADAAARVLRRLGGPYVEAAARLVTQRERREVTQPRVVTFTALFVCSREGPTPKASSQAFIRGVDSLELRFPRLETKTIAWETLQGDAATANNVALVLDRLLATTTRGDTVTVKSILADILSDLLAYRARPALVRAALRQQILDQAVPVVLVAEGAASAACVDLLASNDSDLRSRVVSLMTIGSLAPLAYSLDLLDSLESGNALPGHFPRWHNIYRTNDHQSFLAAPLFPGRVSDIRVVDAPVDDQANREYWSDAAIWAVIGNMIGELLDESGSFRQSEAMEGA